jgi:ASCH domain
VPAARKKPRSGFPAISVRQPGADAIVRGEKRHDVRSRPTRFRGWILVHASATVAKGAADRERGKILGMVQLDDCVRGDGGWTYSWKSPKRFRVAVPFRGHYSIPFYVPAALLRGTPAAKVTPGELKPKRSLS